MHKTYPRATQLLQDDFKKEITNKETFFRSIKDVVSSEEYELAERLDTTDTYSGVLLVMEEAEKTPFRIVAAMLSTNKIFAGVVKKREKDFPNLHKIHSGLVQRYSEKREAKDQGNLEFGIGGEVVVRFPPEPSGCLHIGHAKAAFLNNYYATENGGRLIVRFDDTNPAKEKTRFENEILSDLELLGIKKYTLSHTTDYFDRIYELAAFLMRKNAAYCDDTDKDKIRVDRDSGIESRRRNGSSEENLEIFNGMLQGRNREFCVRAKIDMADCNKAMRDPVILRIVDEEHYRVGRKYKLYPTYDFACPIVDCLEGVTHTLRTNEYRDRNAQYYWFVDALEFRNRPRIVDFSRLNFENTVLSKRKLNYFVNQGYLEWDDPRMPTIKGIIRLGLRMDVLKKYILMQGMAQKTSIISWDKLWAFNKKEIDDCSGRYSAVKIEGAVTLRITDLREFDCRDVLKNRKNSNLGSKTVYYGDEILIEGDDNTFEINDEFTLMNWTNVVVVDRKIDSKGGVELKCKLNPGGDFKKTKKVHWVAKRGATMVTLYEYGSLTIDNEEDVEKMFNFNSVVAAEYYAENSIAGVKRGDTIQFERIGFYYCDDSFRFHLIPSTKQARKL